MSREASSFALVLERIIRNAVSQFRDISDADLNRSLDLPESNTAFALATHLIGAAEYWVLEVAGGHDLHRNRPSEFYASGSSTDLIARYEHYLLSMQQVLADLPSGHLDQQASLTSGYHPSLDGSPMTIRDALLHAVEHSALHQGHLELTRQILGYAPAGEQ